jgi:uncharacterized membrane protein YdbT with pleckstrin-like domain
MSLIDKNLLPGENILFRTRKHIIIFFIPIALVILTLFLSVYMTSIAILARFAWLPPIIGLIYFASAYLEYITSEFVVTDKRVVMREGFFNRHANELRLATVSQVNVYQGIFGQMLGFGDISLNAFGAYDVFVLIAHPFEFQKVLNEQLDKLTR